MLDSEAEAEESQAGEESSPFHTGQKNNPNHLLVTIEDYVSFKKKLELSPSLFHPAINLGFTSFQLFISFDQHADLKFSFDHIRHEHQP